MLTLGIALLVAAVVLFVAEAHVPAGGVLGAGGVAALVAGAWIALVAAGAGLAMAVAVAGGAGLRLGWSIIAPGDRPRKDALAEEGRRSVVIVLGLVLAFLVAGLIEGFVTGRPWPTALRVGVGIAAEVAFLTYVVGQGRRAEADGLTGLLGEDEPRGWART